MAAKNQTIKQVEVLIQNAAKELTWVVLSQAADGKKITKEGTCLTETFAHEKGNVTTQYNLLNFLGYSIVV